MRAYISVLWTEFDSYKYQYSVFQMILTLKISTSFTSCPCNWGQNKSNALSGMAVQSVLTYDVYG